MILVELAAPAMTFCGTPVGSVGILKFGSKAIVVRLSYKFRVSS